MNNGANDELESISCDLQNATYCNTEVSMLAVIKIA